jgi:hypothetical protein
MVDYDYRSNGEGIRFDAVFFRDQIEKILGG